MLERNEKGRLIFDDLGFRIMLDGMSSACKTKKELQSLLIDIQDAVEIFIDQAEEEWEQEQSIK